jgi:ribosomal protein S18 acetylase RimI-like enzyme
VREITGSADFEAACRGDRLCLWAARGLDGPGRAWLSDDGRALAAAGPALATRDRLVLAGDAGAAAVLVGEVLAEVGPTYRPLGDAALIDALAGRVPGLAAGGRFGWMDIAAPGPAAPPPGTAAWLAEPELDEVAEVLAASYPAAYARPGLPGVERWAGVRDGDGQLAAVGALAWSAPAVGFIAGMAVRPAARGRGLGAQVCRLLLAGALARHPAAALMVDDGNHAARALYRGLGLRYRQLSGASVAGAAG